MYNIEHKHPELSPESQFNKDPKRYINASLNSDKRIQMLMLVFAVKFIPNQNIEEFPIEIIQDLKECTQLRDLNELRKFITKYDLREEDYTLYQLRGLKSNYFMAQESQISIDPYGTISKFIEDMSIENVRENKLNQLGI